MEAKELFNLSTYFMSHCHHETMKKPVCISCSNKGFLLLVTAKTDVVGKGTTALAAWQSRRAEQVETCSRDPLTHWIPAGGRYPKGSHCSYSSIYCHPNYTETMVLMPHQPALTV